MRAIRTIGAMGLCVAALIGFAGAEAQAMCVAAARANLRDGPGTNFRITWEVNRYMPLIRIDQKGKWIKVKDLDGDTHWVHQSLIDDKLDCVTVKSPKANIRKGPRASAKKWFTVERYTSFLRVGGKKKWVKIKYMGEPMWVYHTLVWPRSS